MTFQAKLTTKLEKFSVDDLVVELNRDVDKEKLNQLVKSALRQLKKVEESEVEDKTFDFLVGGRFLQLSVDKHLEVYSEEIDADEILSEKLVEIEYVLSLEPPEPLEAIPHEDWVSCVDVNDSYIITGSYDNSIRIISLKDKKDLATIKMAHEKPVTKVKWLNVVGQSKRNELYFISCGHDEVSIMRRFNTKTCKIEDVFVYKGHNRSVNCVDSFDDLVATGSFDKTLRIWSTNLSEDDSNNPDGDEDLENDVVRKKKQKTKTSIKSVEKTSRSAIMTLTGHTESITGIKWLGKCNDYNSLATCSMDRTICIWDVEVGECKRRLLSAKPLLGLDFCSENNLIVTASCDKHVRLWDARAPDNATAKAAYTSHNAWVSSVAFGRASTNNFVSGGYDNLVKLWDLRSPKACLYDMIGHQDKVLDVNWRNPAYVLSASADATLKIFSTK